MVSIADWLRDSAPFSSLPQEALSQLSQELTESTFAPGHCVMKRGDSAREAIWGVLSGEVRLMDDEACRHDSGCLPGDVFGVIGLQDGLPLPYDAMASLPSTCVRIPVATFRRLCADHPSFQSYFEELPLEVPNLDDIGGWVGGIEAGPFAMINQLEQTWGRVLDAGTGNRSLAWLLTAPSSSLTAVTMDDEWAASLASDFSEALRPDDRILVGDWREPSFLHGDVFDVVVADYLIGALERYHPGFQYEFFERIRPHVGRKLYLVGLEPLPDNITTIGEGVLKDAHWLRDASMILAREHPYREYSASWLVKALEQAQFKVEGYQLFPKLHGVRTVHGILSGTLIRHVAHFEEPHMANAMAQSIASVRQRAEEAPDLAWGRRFGQDHLIVASPC